MVLKAQQKINLPWVEKYRPSTLDDLVSHEDIIKTVGKFIREDQVPHLLFYGPPGTGKTSTILACAKQLYTPTQFSSMVLELNASDDRGIGIVRGHILTFASTRTIFKSGFKLIILDEADAMTMDAQNALRRRFLRVLEVLAYSYGKFNRHLYSNGEYIERNMSESEEEVTEKTFKIVFLGDGNVGKTSLIRRYCYDEFSRHYNQTAGADFYMKRLELSKGKEVSMRIFDLGGLQITGQMLKNYLFKANIIVLVYDITSSSSFDNLISWLNTIRKTIDYPTEVVVYGNKNDSEHKRSVGLDRIKRFVTESQLGHFLVSAKTGENVSASLTDLVARHFGVDLSRSNGQKRLPVKQTPTISSPKERSIIEKYTENIRFCIICNYLSKIIPALQSRCTRFRFGPLSPDQILPRLNYVVDEENVTVTEDGKKALLTLANGDMRKVLNVLQSTWLAYKNVTEDNVYSCVGHPLRTDIENIVKWLLNEDFQTTYKNIKELKVLKGLALHDIITEVHKYVHRVEFPFDLMADLLDKMAEIEYRLCSGANENIQLTALVSAFQHLKTITPPEES